MTLLPRAERRLRRLQARVVRAFAPPIEKLAFLHVPKSAGTAISYAIQAALLPGRIVTGFDRSTFGDFADFDTMARRTRAQLYLSPDDISGDTEFLTGHFARSTVDQALPGARQIMLLREPSARVLSQWAYWRALPPFKHREWGAWFDRIRLAQQPLASFLAAPEVACQTDNAYVRALLWPHALIPDAGFIAPSSDASLLAEAHAAMAGLSFSSILENPRLTEGLGRYLGCALRIRSVNVTDAMPRVLQTSMPDEMTAQASELVSERSRLDRELWQSLAERLMSPLAARSLQAATFERIQARYADLMR